MTHTILYPIMQDITLERLAELREYPGRILGAETRALIDAISPADITPEQAIQELREAGVEGSIYTSKIDRWFYGERTTEYVVAAWEIGQYYQNIGNTLREATDKALEALR